ncbi:hypothetical protein AAEO56_00825 [Flavobacterium sp. DGU11]|uniref:Uncharacterized protein n=1 Tax=Flavobacterium arundinis TaxID=3139143 RepID=A0ABU9HS90_9FLAO
MIDKIKIHLKDYSPSDNITWKEKLVEDCIDKSLYNARLYNSAFPKKKFSLKLLLTADEGNDMFNLSIDGSIRKWYYQKNSRKDLNYEEFLDCIELLAKELGTTKKRILAGKVNKVEVGVTLLLKAKMRGINDCFVKYRNAEREVVEETTLYFKFANYKLVFYDKFLEINKNTIWSDVQKKVFETFYFLRFEINAKKVSGTTFKNKFDTVEKIKENWNDLPDVIEKYITNIVFVDVISKEKMADVSDYSDFIIYLTFLGIKQYGVIESINLLDKSLSINNKKKKIEQFIDIYRTNITDDLDLKATLLMELRKKLDRLYNKSKI